MIGKFPKEYEWLLTEPSPRMLQEALNLYGVMETPGLASTEMIMNWAGDLHLESIFTSDSVSWCGLFMAIITKRAGKPVPPKPYRAKSWTDFGLKVPEAMLGDVLIFNRQGGFHVSLYVGEDEYYYHCLGGNQSDMVNITRIEKKRLFAIRRPPYNSQPANVRKIILKPTGSISINEQ